MGKAGWRDATSRKGWLTLQPGLSTPHPAAALGGKVSLTHLLRYCLTKVLPSSGAPLSQPQPSCRVRSRLLLPHLSKSSEDAQEGGGHTLKGLDHSQFILPSSPLNQQLEAQNPKDAERVEPKGVPTNTHCAFRSTRQAFSTLHTSLSLTVTL